MNLHFALAGTPCRVVEIILPAICATLVGFGVVHKPTRDDFCDSIFAVLSYGDAIEIGYDVTARGRSRP
jgi:uncharacterized oxidoreductase